ncbi:hypothetical protein [Mesoplasma florum]|uniref:hypothetical protein n=1 Tax=Mesoplasma florum TaxID=2151 RepID=UPI0018F8735C|nr:hypothetical protein [Mesoplasma florum]
MSDNGLKTNIFIFFISELFSINFFCSIASYLYLSSYGDLLNLNMHRNQLSFDFNSKSIFP